MTMEDNTVRDPTFSSDGKKLRFKIRPSFSPWMTSSVSAQRLWSYLPPEQFFSPQAALRLKKKKTLWWPVAPMWFPSSGILLITRKHKPLQLESCSQIILKTACPSHCLEPSPRLGTKDRKSQFNALVKNLWWTPSFIWHIWYKYMPAVAIPRTGGHFRHCPLISSESVSQEAWFSTLLPISNWMTHQ